MPPDVIPPPVPASALQPITAPPGQGKAPDSAPPPVKPAGREKPAPAAPRRRSAIDTLVARDQTAVFWFIVTCFVAAGCAWYLVIMAQALKARPPFVVMDTAGAYYVAPGLNYDSMLPMHQHLTQVAVETMFERGPLGLVHADRVSRIFNRPGKALLDDILKKEAGYFRTQQVEQTVEIQGEPVLRRALATASLTEATGLVTRRSVFKGQVQVETYQFKVGFIWRMNPDMRTYRSYPAVIEKIPTYSLEKLSE